MTSLSDRHCDTFDDPAALEHAATAKSRRLLQALAEGAQGAWLTEEAKAVCARVGG